MRARAGVHLAVSTAGRTLKSAPAKPPTAPTSEASNSEEPTATTETNGTALKPKPERKIIANYANHVWGVQLTAMPILARRSNGTVRG
jgi:cell division septation protein DedD